MSTKSIFSKLLKRSFGGEKPPNDVEKLQARYECAMKVLREIAARDRKTVEQRLASSCVSFLDNL